MIESKFTSFEVQVERSFMDPPETDKPSFRAPQEAFNPVHMRSPPDKLILAMIDSKISNIPDIDQSILPAPPVRIDHAVQGDLPANNRLQRGFSAVRNEFRVDLLIPLEDPKDNGFPIRPAAPFSFDPSSPKVGFIDFHFSAERRLGFREFRNACSNNPHIPTHGIANQSGQESYL